LSGTTGGEELWRYCITDTDGVVGMALGAMFVREAFQGGEQTEGQNVYKFLFLVIVTHCHLIFRIEIRRNFFPVFYWNYFFCTWVKEINFSNAQTVDNKISGFESRIDRAFFFWKCKIFKKSLQISQRHFITC
jgi:hypothetical protein